MRFSLCPLVASIALSLVAGSSAWAHPTDQSEVRGRTVRPLHPPRVFERLGSNEGLPQDQVRDIVQDNLGFMWIATEGGGVARYDGSTMWPLGRSSEGERSLSSSFITALEIADDGRLWIGTGDAGVSVYDHNTGALVHYQHGAAAESLSSNGVLSLFSDKRGGVWVGTNDGVLNSFQRESRQFRRIELPGVEDIPITEIAQRGDDGLWLGTAGAGLIGFDPAQGSVSVHYRTGGEGADKASRLPDDSVRALLGDAGDNDGQTLWIGTDGGLARLALQSGAMSVYRHEEGRDSLSDDRVTALLRDRNGVLWVGTRSGLNAMDSRAGTFTRYAPDRAYPVITASYPNQVSAAFQDRSGVLWFGTQAGLRKLDPVRANLDHYVNASGEGDRMCFSEGAPGVLWAGTYAGGLQKIDHERGEITIYAQLGRPGTDDFIELSDWITALYRDSKANVLWMSGVGLGLIALDEQTGQHTHYPPDPSGVDGPTVARLDRIIEGEDGALWLASWGGGLLRFDRENREFSDFLHAEDEPDSLASDHLYTISPDRKDDNIIWVGTANRGLDRFDIAKETATHFQLAPEGSEVAGYKSVVSIHQDEAGILWLGTHRGLVSLNPASGKLMHFSSHAGLVSTIYGILADESGTLWLGTNGSGLIAFDPRDRSVDTYTAADGFASREFNQGGFYQTASGELLVSGIGGFNAFRPKDILADRYAPPTVLTSFKVFNDEYALDRPIWTLPDIELGYTDSVFSLEFAGLSYAAPGQLRYAYKMDGLHDWIETSQPIARYTNVEGGDYTFRVRATNRHGGWGPEATLSVHMNPAPWKTTWAYVLYAIILLTLVLLYLQYQARKVAALQQAHRLESLERDLELTSVIQAGFLPDENPLQGRNFHIYGYYRPASKTGGDWWWYERSESKLTIVVGDVTGHGTGPAMMTAAAAAAFRAQGVNPNITLRERLSRCNSEVSRVGNGKYLMTLSALELELSTGHFTLYSAGGQPIIRLVANGQPRTLSCPGTPLGSAHLDIGVLEGNMGQGERFVFFTDGIPEAMLDGGRQLGMRRFTMICEETKVLALSDAVTQIVESADASRRKGPQADDWTLVVVEWSGPG